MDNISQSEVQPNLAADQVQSSSVPTCSSKINLVRVEMKNLLKFPRKSGGLRSVKED